LRAIFVSAKRARSITDAKVRVLTDRRRLFFLVGVRISVQRMATLGESIAIACSP
jgi:hypothetical protein